MSYWFIAGLRIGEILGLRWKDIDFKNKTISIENAITMDVKFDESGEIVDKKTILSTPKTKNSIAVLPMVDILFGTLKDWYQERFDLGCKKNIDLVNPNTYVMANDDGSIRTYYGTRAIYRRFLDKHNLKQKEFHFHALRHTFATKLRENNENIYFIQDLMRHTTTRTTEKYMSKDKNNAINNAKKLNAVFNDNGYVSNKKDDFEM